MTTEHWIELEKKAVSFSFKQKAPWLMEWQSACQAAACWLLEISKSCVLDMNLGLVTADDYPSGVDKISSYYGFRPDATINEFKQKGAILAGEYQFEIADKVIKKKKIHKRTKKEYAYEFVKEGGVLCTELFKLSDQSLVDAIDFTRELRQSFLFFADPSLFEDSKAQRFLERLADLRIASKFEGMDEPQTIELLMEEGIYPIRVFGRFDDTELFVDIYGGQRLREAYNEGKQID